MAWLAELIAKLFAAIIPIGLRWKEEHPDTARTHNPTPVETDRHKRLLSTLPKDPPKPH